MGLTTPATQPLPGITRRRFSPIRFRSPLLTQSLLFSLPVGTEMFHFPTFPPTAYFIQRLVTHHNSMPGFPIRRSWPQHSVISSTRLIADSHVLHQLLMPRHPPCALKHLRHTYTRQYKKDARVHYAVPKQQPPPPSPQPPHKNAGHQPWLPEAEAKIHEANSLRTQQCTKNHSTTPNAFLPTHTPKSVQAY